MDIQSNLFEMAWGIKQSLYIKNITFDEEISYHYTSFVIAESVHYS